MCTGFPRAVNNLRRIQSGWQELLDGAHVVTAVRLLLAWTRPLLGFPLFDIFFRVWFSLQYRHTHRHKLEYICLSLAHKKKKNRTLPSIDKRALSSRPGLHLPIEPASFVSVCRRIYHALFAFYLDALLLDALATSVVVVIVPFVAIFFKAADRILALDPPRSPESSTCSLWTRLLDNAQQHILSSFLSAGHRMSWIDTWAGVVSLSMKPGHSTGRTTCC